MHKLTFGVFALAAWVFAVTAFAQNRGITVFKTPPLRDSDVFTFPVEKHFSGLPPAELPGAGWAGVRVKIHVQDPTEVDVDSIVPAPGYLIRYPGSPTPGGPLPGIYTGPIPDPFGPRSNNVGSVPIIVTLIHPLASQSGINHPASHVEPLLNLVLHAKNTNLGQNSDIDVTMMFSDVWHDRGGTGSEIIHFPESVHIWGHSFLDDPGIWEQFHISDSQDPQYASNYRIPEGPPIGDPEGHWVHLPVSLPFHTVSGLGSNFFAYMAATVLGVGIEHVPEPTSAALLGMSIVCASMGVFSRRRRCSQQ